MADMAASNLDQSPTQHRPSDITMSNTPHTPDAPSAPTNTTNILIRYSCPHSFPALVSSDNMAIARGPLSHACMPCSYRRAEDAEAEVVKRYEGTIEKLEIWLDGLRGNGPVQAFLLDARMKLMEDLNFVKWKRNKEVGEAWEDFDTHWGKKPVQEQRTKGTEGDDEMKID
ncbi:MAG: hypothetical protein Q9217_006508 [Psora testacea]